MPRPSQPKQPEVTFFHLPRGPGSMADSVLLGLRTDSQRLSHYMHHTHLSNLPPIQIFLLIPVLFLALAMYFFPTILAIKKNSPHTTAVVILNIFFGFTLLGWIVALVLAG